jgi:predicted transglutaminase-like cysteine proteinase
VNDVKAKVLQIPAPGPGNIVGYEYEVEEQPFVLQDTWYLQETAPIRQSHYSVQLPVGWEYKASWLNHPEVRPVQATNNQWEWAVGDVEGIRKEDEMPPMSGVAAQMTVSFFPPGGAVLNEFTTWQGMGTWYLNLTSGRRDASAEIKQQVGVLTALAHTPLEKMQAIAQFIQRDIRYVAIELGIGGWQPHPATDVFSHRYGDCKDKATLTAAMLNEIGVESYYVVINVSRGSVGRDSPARVGGFNHAILAIKLPPGLTDPSLIATIQDPKLGKLLFFDPTNELTPFGQIGGYLQSNYGLLVSPDGSELVELPQQPATSNSVQRTAKLTLDASGKLQGEVKEVRFGDRARSERRALRSTTKAADQIKPIQNLLAGSLSSFRITKASIVNLQLMDQPFGFNYSFESENYAKNAGNLLLVRPRVLGVKSEALLETKEPRKFPVEFDAPVRDTDTFEIVLPAGYEVDDLPPPVDADYSFASYHSKTEADGGSIRYTRTFEIKELSVPVSRAADLKTFYRTIAGDERNTAVLKISSK